PPRHRRTAARDDLRPPADRQDASTSLLLRYAICSATLVDSRRRPPLGSESARRRARATDRSPRRSAAPFGAVAPMDKASGLDLAYDRRSKAPAPKRSSLQQKP